MIFNGSDGGAVPGTNNNTSTAVASFNLLTDEEADGYYLDFGYRISSKVELDLRYDVLNRGTKTSSNERQFKTTTLGMQYFLNIKTRVLLNYELREAEAPGLVATHAANQILDSMDDRLSMQVLVIY